jgi:hypothetical protein
MEQTKQVLKNLLYQGTCSEAADLLQLPYRFSYIGKILCFQMTENSYFIKAILEYVMIYLPSYFAL